MFRLQKDKCKASLFSEEETLMSLTVCHKAVPNPTHEIPIINHTNCSINGKCNIGVTEVDGGWKVSNLNGKGWRNWQIVCKPSRVIFPSREGERISDLRKLPIYRPYKLSYPGTASSKCMVVFNGKNRGFVVGSEPSLDWAELKLLNIEDNRLLITFFQDRRNLYVLPFQGRWKAAVQKFRNLTFPTDRVEKSHQILNCPRFLLQMGVRDFNGLASIDEFSDLRPLIETFRKKLGKGHIVHLFGTSGAGFDRMLPDFSIDPRLGGTRGLAKLVGVIHSLELFASHHFNPRIASLDWIKSHPEYQEASILNPDGNPWIEYYKGSPYYVMNPSHDRWLSYCLNVIRDFKDIGFDYLELDQIAYQRNLANRENDIGEGFQKMIELTAKEGIYLWVEGVSDIYKLPPDAFFQVLPRDRTQMWWETQENRRGYPYGVSYPQFYRCLMPNSPISCQIVTEKFDPKKISLRLALARKLGAAVLDLELGFVNSGYQERFESTLEKILEFNGKET